MSKESTKTYEEYGKMSSEEYYMYGDVYNV
jgi:hypothetical protein